MKILLVIVLWIIAGWAANWIMYKETVRTVSKQAEEKTGELPNTEELETMTIDLYTDASEVYDFDEKRFSLVNTIKCFVVGVILWPITLPWALHVIHRYTDEIAEEMTEVSKKF